MKISHLEQQFKRYALHEKGLKLKTYKSIDASVKMLCHFSNTDELNRLNQSAIREFLYQGRCKRGWKAQTFRNHWHYLKSFFNWCEKSSFITSNPLIGIEKPKPAKILPRCISSEEAKKVLYHTATYQWRYRLEKYRNEAIVATLMMTGVRLQELIHIGIADVNMVSREILIREGKGRKDRCIPIHIRLSSILRTYLEKKSKFGKPSRWFFTGINSDKKLNSKDVRRICHKISIDSGVKFTPHMLRHTFAREMIDNDLNLYKLKMIMGHADITTTQRYLAISIKGIKDSVDQVNIF